MPELLDIPPKLDLVSLKLDFLKYRSEGLKYEDTLLRLSKEYSVNTSKVRYYATKYKWADPLHAIQGKLEAKVGATIESRVTKIVEKIADGFGGKMLDILDEFNRVPVKKPLDLVAKANALKTLSEVKSRYNPDGQERSGGQTLFQVNIDTKQSEKPAVEVHTES